MNKTQIGFKRCLTTAITLLLSILLALSIVQLPLLSAFAETSSDTVFTEPDAVELSMSNKQFADGSGAYPMTPSNWSGSGVGGSDAGTTVSGIVDLTASHYNDTTKEDDVYKLSQYPEYKTGVPQTPFGGNAFVGTNKKVLMVNTYNSTTAYGYTSDTVSFAANKYYRVSVYVKTGNFPEGKGATVKLNGLPEDVAIRNINTVRGLEKDAAGLPILNESNLYGFQKYTIYVATPSMTASEVTLSLQVGDAKEDDEEGYYYPAQGYAFFDNVEAVEVSPNVYYHETAELSAAGSNHLIADFTTDSHYLTDSGDISYLYKENGVSAGDEIGSFERGLDGWTYINDVEGVTSGHIAEVYDTGAAFNKDNVYGLENRPVSPLGYFSGNSKMLIIASNEKSSGIAVGYRSAEYTVLRNTFYRISYWVNTENVQNGSGATAVIRGENGIFDDENKLVVSASNLSGDTAATTKYGWKEYSFYIKGSALKDYKISMELWLGQPDSLSTGIAMFDEVKIQKISSTEYSSNSSSGTIVTFDPSFADTGVSNGLFFEAGDYEEYKYPLAPASWTKQTPDTVETTGFSSKAVDSAEDAVSGIISTDADHFEANRENYNYISNPSVNSGNLLMISSEANTALCYQSPSLTVTANSKNTLTVSLKTVQLKGYGVNLVVKNGNNVVATIEKITDTGSDFKTYTFYLEGGSADKNVTVEIWLGMNDRVSNKTKLASGTVFVNNVSFKTMDESDSYAAYAQRYADYRSYGMEKFDFAAYSFNTLDMSAYDYYQEGTVKTPYNWSLSEGAIGNNAVYGIFDYKSLKESETEIPSYFQNETDKGNGVLYLRNVAADYSKITTINNLSLAENSYYKISFNIKVDLPKTMLDDKNAVGAGIQLTGTDFKFENIKDTSTVLDKTNPDESTDRETFKTYTFYVKTSEAKEVGLSVSLGGNEYPNRYCAGRVYVNQISMTTINATDYEDAVKVLHDKDETNDNPYIVDAAFDSATTDGGNEDGGTDGTNNASTLAWWLIPSILFAVALLIAVIGTAIRRLMEKRASNKQVLVANSYDRTVTLNKIHNDNAAKKNEDAKVESVGAYGDDEIGYDEFDDTLPTPKAAPVKETVVPETSAEQSIEEPTETDVFDDATESTVSEDSTAKQEASKAAEEIETVAAPKAPVKAANAPTQKPAPTKDTVTASDVYNDEFED